MPNQSPLDVSSGHNNADPNPNSNPKHFILIPFMAQGHMIPMVDIARLLAAAGSLVTLITTPVNAARIRPTIVRIQNSGLPIRFIELPFPSSDAGLPSGCENLDLIPSPDLFKPFVEALPLFGERVKLYLKEEAAPVNCIVFDSLNSWVALMAKSLGIPHVLFHGPSCFYILCSFLLTKHQLLKGTDDDCKLFRVPELPEPVEVIMAQVGSWLDRPGWEKIKSDYVASEKSAYGVVLNTFEELEMMDLEKYRVETGKKVWPIGPLSLSNSDVDSKAMRGKVSSIDTELLLSWLDSKPASSVMFVSFGSLVRNSLSQLLEIGQGLESASPSFIWVVKEEESCPKADAWLSEFEERTLGKGLLIRGWAPQAIILSHAAVGGFMTHCGWNSTLEAVAAGVVMVTWPRFSDQFLNERLVIDVLRVGVVVGKNVPTFLASSMSENALVKGEEVRTAVEKVMDGGTEGEERRKRAKEFGEKAKRAMEDGGSSFQNLREMIRFVKN